MLFLLSLRWTAYDVVQGACIAGDGHEPAPLAPTRIAVLLFGCPELIALLGVVALAGAIRMIGTMKSALGLARSGAADHPWHSMVGELTLSILWKVSNRSASPIISPAYGGWAIGPCAKISAASCLSPRLRSD
jgi:hypothetical protein